MTISSHNERVISALESLVSRSGGTVSGQALPYNQRVIYLLEQAITNYGGTIPDQSLSWNDRYVALLEQLGSAVPSAQKLSSLVSTNLADWVDPNNVLASVAVSGDTVTLGMQNQAASRDLPTTGASLVIPIKNLKGSLQSSLHLAAIRAQLITVLSGTAIPQDCWVGIVWINASTVAGATGGTGMMAYGTGTGIRALRFQYNVGWSNAGTGTASASVRRILQLQVPGTANQDNSIAQTVSCLDSNSQMVAAASIGGTSAYTSVTGSYVALCCGWLTGSGGSSQATITCKPYLIASLAGDFPGVG